jgi:phospholipid-binding lipoprotein MlaA
MEWAGDKVVKSLWLAVCIMGLPLGVVGQESSSQPSPPPAPPAAKEGEDKAFHDPFATESEVAKPVVKSTDPLEPVNRAFFVFNDKLYYWALEPVSRGYSKVVPAVVRLSVKRLFANAKYPVRFVNNLLQGKFPSAGIETSRFVANSTLGVGGLMDPALVYFKLESQPADFDQTLGVYGLAPGPYLNWPLLGPSSVRGTVGLAGDTMLSPLTYYDFLALTLAVRPYETINDTSLRLGEYESFKQAALDPYVAMRSFYFENRYGFVHRRLEGSKPINTPSSEDLALARYVRAQRAIVNRLEFAQEGVSSGTKGAEMLMRKDGFTAPRAGRNSNLNVDFLRDSGTAAPSPTNTLTFPKKTRTGR